jgi:hypothetical protein
MSVQQSFESFMKQDFQYAVDQATIASWGGSGYSVELLDGGSYRVLWDSQIGNLYDSPGLILSVPSLTDEEWNEDPAFVTTKMRKSPFGTLFRSIGKPI